MLSSHCSSSVALSSTSSSCTTAWLVTGLLTLNLAPCKTWCLVKGEPLPGLTGSEVLPQLRVDGHSLWQRGASHSSHLRSGCWVSTTHRWLTFFSTLWGFEQQVFLLPITKLTNSFKIALNVRSVISTDAVKVWLIQLIVGLMSVSATSSLSPPWDFRVALQSFWKWPNPSHFQQALDLAWLSLTWDWCAHPSSPLLMTGHTCGDLHHLRGSS